VYAITAYENLRNLFRFIYTNWIISKLLAQLNELLMKELNNLIGN
jgi:hypothetical protein